MWRASLARHRNEKLPLLIAAMWNVLSSIAGYGFLFTYGYRLTGGLAIIFHCNLLWALAGLRVWVRVRSGPRRFLAVLPDGLWLTGRHYRPKSIPWPGIESAEIIAGRIPHDFKINLKPKGFVFLSQETRQILKNPKDVAARINAHARRASPANPGELN